ncbi:MAG: hypothetical protein KGV58_01040 [Campylobacteraceae bacterium]|nr:hypothetical protein [Campylobacteraceae bacterium]
MTSRLKIFVLYLKNNRLKEYEEIISEALKNNYEIISLRDYACGNYDKSKKILLLRHDIDYISLATHKMFEIETKYNVRSSFYFRNSTYEPKLMKQIESYGSESSLHFETIADYVKANLHVKSKEDLFKIDFQQNCLDILRYDIERFRLLCGISCLTIASHGEYENVLVQTPNNFLTENTATYEYLGIKLEAYNKELMKKVTCYVSDCPIENNEGYRYGVHPLEAIKNDEKFIIFLTHPNHWYYDKYGQFVKLVKTLIKRPVYKKENFKRL